MSGDDSLVVFQGLVARVKSFGLPVTFLLAAGKRFPPVFTDDLSSFSRGIFRDELRLNRDVVQTLAGLSPGAPLGGREARAVATVYHEGTHAYFGLMKGVSPVKELVEEGIAYYQGAPLKGVPGGTVSQSERVVQEAAGMYVDNRVFGWWTAFQHLAFAGSGAGFDDAGFRKLIEIARDTYDRCGAERTVGYQHRWLASQESVDKPIFPALKAFIDTRLLEGKVPDRFGEVVYFQQLIVALEAARQASRPFSLPVPTR
jgi:hypothetical protein